METTGIPRIAIVVPVPGLTLYVLRSPKKELQWRLGVKTDGMVRGFKVSIRVCKALREVFLGPGA